MHRDNQVNDTLSLEEQNHLLLKETLRIVRQMRRIYLIQVSMTIAFVVLPIIATALFLPKIISSLQSTVESFTTGLTTSGENTNSSPLINQQQLNDEIMKQLNNAQRQ